MRWRVSGLVAVLALTACSAGGPGPSTPPASHSVPAPIAIAPVNPDALVGLWRVAAAAGEPGGTVLRLSADEPFRLILFRGCGELSGSWAATAGAGFVAMTSAWSNACSATPGKGRAPAWLLRARSYRMHGAERDLLAADGTVLAKLLPAAKPHTGADILPALREKPTLSQAALKRLREVPKALPAGTSAATDRTIAGRWVPIPALGAVTSQDRFLSFSANGDWASKDGCNGAGGRFTVGEGGWLLLLAGPFAATGACAGSEVSGLLTDARRAAVTGGQLTFYAGDGSVVGRFTR
ncbi:MAG TPA: hypothetical protein VHZ96_13985 [Frankiaceae bacterium]|nr:hypothetical protein [Frankiaceae bacterium]